RPGLVGADEVSLHDAAVAGDVEPVGVRASDAVASSQGGSADGVVGAHELDAEGIAPEVGRTRDVDADEVSLDEIAAPGQDDDPVALDVGRRGRGPADRVVRASKEYGRHPGRGEPDEAGDVGADEVAFDHGSRDRPRVAELDLVAAEVPAREQ